MLDLHVVIPACRLLAWVAVGSHSSVVIAPVAKAGGPGFSSAGWLTNVDGMKDLWCINTDMNGMKYLWCSSTVRLLYEWKDLWCSITVRLLSTQT